ncbi:MAG: HEAT repeat domain-containing protein [Candidatus Eremiobacterota bacterium]
MNKKIFKYSILLVIFSFLLTLFPVFSDGNCRYSVNSVAKAESVSFDEELPMSRKVKKFIDDLENPSSDDDTRHTAVWALGNLGDKRAVPCLIKVLEHDKNENIRSIAAEALGKLEDKQSVKPLIKALKDPDWGVRVDAVYAFGRLKDFSSDAIPSIIECLKDEDETVRMTAARVLGDFKDTRAVDPLCKTLGDKNQRVKTAAISSLGLLGDSKAVEPLFQLFKQGDSDVIRASVVRSLGEIKSDKSIQYVTEALSDKNIFVRMIAVTTLGKIGDEKTLEVLEKISKTEEDSDMKDALKKSIENIKRALKK